MPPLNSLSTTSLVDALLLLEPVSIFLLHTMLVLLHAFSLAQT
jgi:hypothetical protein